MYNFKRIVATVALLGLSFTVQADDIALRTYRICNTSPLLLKNTGPLNPDDMASAPNDHSWIVDAQVLPVNISYPEKACNSECQRTVSDTFVSSLNIWRQLCLQCGYGLFTFVVDHQNVYVERGVADIIKDSRLSFFDRILNAHKILLDMTGRKPVGNSHVFSTYTRISRMDSAIQDFCRAELALDVRKLWPGKLATAVCGEEPSGGLPTVTISFKLAPPCNEPSFIACGTSAVGLQLDLVRTAYIVRKDPAQSYLANDDAQKLIDEAPVLLGNQDSFKVDLEAIFIHEIGHLLGIGHLSPEDQPDTNATPAMRAVYDPNFCLSNAEMMLVNSAASARWRFKAKPCMGVLRPPRG